MKWMLRPPGAHYGKRTREGAARGRGLDHFRAESTKLVRPAPKDAYEDEAFACGSFRRNASEPRAPSPYDMFLDEDE